MGEKWQAFQWHIQNFVKHFRKTFHLRNLTGCWIHLCLFPFFWILSIKHFLKRREIRYYLRPLNCCILTEYRNLRTEVFNYWKLIGFLLAECRSTFWNPKFPARYCHSQSIYGYTISIYEHSFTRFNPVLYILRNNISNFPEALNLALELKSL